MHCIGKARQRATFGILGGHAPLGPLNPPMLEMYLTASNRGKISLKPLFWGSRSFKVIDVGTTGKLVSSACYDKQ